MSFDWNKSVAYDDAAKRQFHNKARTALRKLAAALELEPGTFEIRSNKAGMAVSGEVTLHGRHVYVQASQPAFGGDNGILYRRCRDRRDYVGEHNHFASLRALNNIDALAAAIERDLGPCYKLNANEVD